MEENGADEASAWPSARNRRGRNPSTLASSHKLPPTRRASLRWTAWGRKEGRSKRRASRECILPLKGECELRTAARFPHPGLHGGRTDQVVGWEVL